MNGKCEHSTKNNDGSSFVLDFSCHGRGRVSGQIGQKARREQASLNANPSWTAKQRASRIMVPGSTGPDRPTVQYVGHFGAKDRPLLYR